MPDLTMLQAFKELGQFIGSKLDDVKVAVQTQKINILETGETGKTIADEFSKKLQENLDKKGINVTVDTAEFKRAIQMLISQTASHEKEILNIARMSQPKDFGPGLSAIERAVRGIKFDKVDLSKLGKLDDIEKAVFGLASAMNKKDNKNLEDKLDLMNKKLEVIANNRVEIPKSFSLDKMQLASLTSGLKTTPGPIQPNSVSLNNTTLVATNTEYSYVFPARTASFFIKSENQAAKINYAWATGTLPAGEGGGDGTNYITIPQNGLFSREGLALGGRTIYLGSDTAGAVAQIESYQY